MRIEELLNHYNIPYKKAGEHHHCREGWKNIDCVYCSPDHQKWRLGIHETYLYTNCWSCGYHSLVNVLHEITKVSHTKLREQLGDLDRLKEEKEKVRKNLILPKYLEELSRPHMRYLLNRGFKVKEIVKLYGLKGLSVAGRLSWRIFIPFYYRGKIVSWTTRSIGEKEPRYINAAPYQETMRMKDMLFGEDLAANSVIITEGPFDAMKIGRGAVALMGMNYTSSQVNKLRKYLVRAVCFDQGTEAQRRAKKLCAALSVFDGETVRIELDAKDPACASEQELTALRKRFLK